MLALISCINVQAKSVRAINEELLSRNPDSVTLCVRKLLNAWVDNDSVGIYEFKSILLNENLPRSQFYLYTGWLESLSGLWFGTYEDPDELGPELDGNIDTYDQNRRRIIVNFYQRLDKQFLFKHFPEPFKLYFVDLFMVSMHKNELDTLFFDHLLHNLKTEVKDSNLNVKIKEIKFEPDCKGKYFAELNEHFKASDKNYFVDIQSKLEDVSLDDSDFFEISADLLSIIQLTFYKGPTIKISEYVFINRANYGELRHYLVFFFRCYFQSQLCFRIIPTTEVNDIFEKAYKEDYSNINRDKELIAYFNQLNHQIKR